MRGKAHGDAVTVNQKLKVVRIKSLMGNTVHLHWKFINLTSCPCTVCQFLWESMWGLTTSGKKSAEACEILELQRFILYEKALNSQGVIQYCRFLDFHFFQFEITIINKLYHNEGQKDKGNATATNSSIFSGISPVLNIND